MRTIVRVLATVVGVALVGLAAVGVLNLSGVSAFSTSSRSHSTEVIQAIERSEQIALLSLSVQGLEQANEDHQFFGVNIPGASRAKFIQYQFTAKIGIDGKDVKIEDKGGNKILISIPEFIMIGYSKPHFESAVEKNGVLSWFTPQIDSLDIANKILDSPETQKKYIDANREILVDQAQSFYRLLILSVDPTAEVEFTFQNKN